MVVILLIQQIDKTPLLRTSHPDKPIRTLTEAQPHPDLHQLFHIVKQQRVNLPEPEHWPRHHQCQVAHAAAGHLQGELSEQLARRARAGGAKNMPRPPSPPSKPPPNLARDFPSPPSKPPHLQSPTRDSPSPLSEPPHLQSPTLRGSKSQLCTTRAGMTARSFQWQRLQ